MSDFSSTDRVALYRSAETNWGQANANPEFTPFRMTGESLNGSIQTERSREIRPDRMVTDIVPVDASASGGVNFEMSYGSYDDLIEASLMGTWGTPVNISAAGSEISLSTSGDTVTSSDTGQFSGIVVGQWIRLSGFSASGGANNGYYLVTAKTGDELAVTPAIAANETSTSAVKIEGTLLRNGTVRRSFTLQKRITDVSPVVYHNFFGMRSNTMELAFTVGAILTGSFGFLGRNDEMLEAAISGQTDGSASTTDSMNSASGISDVRQDNTVRNGIRSMNLSVSNNMREQKELGLLGSAGIAEGKFNVTGTSELYFRNRDDYLKFRGNQTFSSSFRVFDVAGNAYIFTWPRQKYTEMTSNAAQENEDLMVNASWEALRDPVTGCVMQVDKFAAPA